MINFPKPKNCRNYLWTTHSKRKLFQYNLTPNTVKRIIRHPDRREEGIAEKTIAVMKDKSSKTVQKEIWVMYQMVGLKKKIISTWIYPGKTKPGAEIYVPDEVWLELSSKNIKFNNRTDIK